MLNSKFETINSKQTRMLLKIKVFNLRFRVSDLFRILDLEFRV
jgi:hypothetical protein